EMAAMGVAGVVIDSFRPRGVRSTIQDQSAVATADFNLDALRILTALAGSSRIDRARIGIAGFSNGGTSSLMAAHERFAAAAGVPAGLRYALHVPFYPACFTHYHRPKTTGAPIYMLIGGADSYVGVEPCTTYGAALQASGARLEIKVYPNAAHGFDSMGGPWLDPMGENTSQCVFTEQADGSFSSRQGFKILLGADGLPIRNQAAVNACITKGVSGGPNAEARTQSMEDLKSYVRRHLLGG
ncbi:MAG: dienelactone hydrolase family protein, partial [Alphaproteobacteria bacterium]|nr:dienelactone hydrolase family protein [Alphaproteobacteria bacterium]